MKTFKAFLIDAVAKSVTEVEIDADDTFGSYYRLLVCSTIMAVQFNGHRTHTLWLDDNGLLSDPTCFYRVDPHNDIFATRGIVVGNDSDGGDEDRTPDLHLDDVQRMVSFPDVKFEGFDGIRVGSKLATVAALLTRSGGCTAADVMKANHWPAVSMPQQAAAAGLNLRKEKAPGEVTRYFGSAA